MGLAGASTVHSKGILDDDGEVELSSSVVPTASQVGSVEISQAISEGSNNFWNTKCEVKHTVAEGTNLDDIAAMQRRFIITSIRAAQDALFGK